MGHVLPIFCALRQSNQQNYKLVQTLGAPQLSAARVLAARKDQLGKPAPEAPTE